MYCYKCGKEIPDSAVFCSFCGAEQQNAARSASQTQSIKHGEPVVPHSNVTKPDSSVQGPKKKKKGKKTVGVILMILGGLSVLGSVSNGFYSNLVQLGPDLADLTALALQAGFLIGGFRLISKSGES